MRKDNFLFILFFGFLFCSSDIFCQNLVNNPSFEDTIPDIIYPGPPQLRSYFWFWPTVGSSDFFNSVIVSSGYGGGVPSNPFGFQYPRTGDVYLGFGLCGSGAFPFVNSREYIEGVLVDTLLANHKYCLTFYVSASNNYLYKTDDIGAFFSLDSLINYADHFVLNVIPQVENTQGNILNDTLNWMLVSGDFIAQGGEKYITIGNFKDDANTTLDTNFGGTFSGSYYYIDDVSLTDSSVGIQEQEKLKFSLSPNPAADKLYINLEMNFIGNENLDVWNMLGKKMIHFDYNQMQRPREIDIGMLAPGMYFLSISSKGNYSVVKFIKE